MFWHQAKSIFLKHISIFLALAVLAMALALYLPSFGQEARLLEKHTGLEKETLQAIEELEEAVLLRDKLLVNTAGLETQIDKWEGRADTLRGYLLEKPDGEDEENE